MADLSRSKGIMGEVRSLFSDLFGGGKLTPTQELTIEVLFGLLGYLAGADSIVTSHEAEFTNQMMDELDLTARARDVAHDAFTRGRKRQIDIDTEVQRFLTVHPKGSPEVGRLYDALLRLAVADGRVRPAERIFLEKVTLSLGYTRDALTARLGV